MHAEYTASSRENLLGKGVKGQHQMLEHVHPRSASMEHGTSRTASTGQTHCSACLAGTQHELKTVTSNSPSPRESQCE